MHYALVRMRAGAGAKVLGNREGRRSSEAPSTAGGRGAIEGQWEKRAEGERRCKRSEKHVGVRLWEEVQQQRQDFSLILSRRTELGTLCAGSESSCCRFQAIPTSDDGRIEHRLAHTHNAADTPLLMCSITEPACGYYQVRPLRPSPSSTVAYFGFTHHHSASSTGSKALMSP